MSRLPLADRHRRPAIPGARNSVHCRPGANFPDEPEMEEGRAAAS